MTQEFLSPAAVAASRRPLAEAYTLPPVAYTDPGLWHVEKARVLARSWLPLARVDQVPGAGCSHLKRV